jgi:protein-L-isoaspartate(D-aspartate) O-methyltransferase
LVALDETERLDNGLPSLWAFLFDAASIRPTDHVVHIGCGTGYYTAILAELVQPDGRITAIECDAKFAKQASENLSHLKQVTVVHGNGCRHDPGEADVILVNAGVTELTDLWLNRLTMGGRLLLPLTVDSRQGSVFLITRYEQGHRARSLASIEIYSCESGRTKEGNALLQVAFWKEKPGRVKSLRRDRHALTDSCWLHAERFCLSKQSH